MTEGERSAVHDLADKAGRSYWDRVWQGQPLPAAFDPNVRNRHTHVQRAFHEFFVRIFADGKPEGHELLEIGAARSTWLPYFAREFGFNVTGIDYSEIGCEKAKAILHQADVDGRIVLADFSDPPADMLGAFDVVVSFGVIEHFEDTAGVIENFARLLRPEGLMISVIPNMTGEVGWLQKRLCRAIFDVHVPLDRRALRTAHERAGLTVRSCRYFLGAGFTSLNLACWSESRLYAAICRLPLALSMPFWTLERVGLHVRPNRLTSPYVICLAQK